MKKSSVETFDGIFFYTFQIVEIDYCIHFYQVSQIFGCVMARSHFTELVQEWV